MAARVGNVHDAIRPIYFMSRLTCVFPYKYQKNNEIIPLSMWDKIVSYSFGVALIVGFGWILYKMITNLVKEFSILLAGVMLGIGSEAIISVHAILTANAIRPDLKNDFFVLLDEIDTRSDFFKHVNFAKIRRECVKEWLFLMFYNLSTTGVLFAVVPSQLTVNTLKVYSTYYVGQYALIMTMCQIICKLKLLNYHFEFLNDKIQLHAELSNKKGEDVMLVKLYEEYKSELYIRKLLYFHGKLCNLFKTINDTHGVQMALLFGSVVLADLYHIYTGTVDAIYTINGKLHIVEGIGLTVHELFEAFLYNGIIYYLVVNCAKATEEVQKTGVIVSNILMDLKKDTNYYSYKRQHMKNLEIFLLQLSIRNPHISAKGIFTVDYTTISSLLTSVTTYFIILLQLKL